MKIKFLSFLIFIILVFGSVSFVFAANDYEFSFVDFSNSSYNFDSSTGNFQLLTDRSAAYLVTLFRVVIDEANGYYSGTFTVTNPSAFGNFAFYNSSGSSVSASSSVGDTISIGKNTYLQNLVNTQAGDGLNLYEIGTYSPLVTNYNYTPAPVVTGSYNLPCGNTIYLDLGVGTSFNLSFDCTFRDTAGGLNSTFADTFYYAFANTIPETTSSFTPSVGTYITMYKDMDSANLFGFTKVGHGTISGTSTGQYLVIVNPLMFAKTTNVYNTTLKINGIPAGTTIYTYPVSSSISGDEVMSTINTSVGGIGTVSASGGAITTVSTEDNSIVYVPNAGGNTVLNSEENIVEGYLSGLNQTLNDFFNNFITLFSKPISYIQSLIASGSNFISHLAYLWSWLPAEISSVIQSAMIVTISVAVFKVFL